MHGTRVPMPCLCWMLSQLLQGDERPVADMTGHTGFYNVNLSFLPSDLSPQQIDQLPAAMRDRPSLFDAFKEQLGLKRTAGKGPGRYFVIDHIERPSAN